MGHGAQAVGWSMWCGVRCRHAAGLPLAPCMHADRVASLGWEVRAGAIPGRISVCYRFSDAAHWAGQAGHGRCGSSSATVTQLSRSVYFCLQTTPPQPQLTGLAKLGMGIAGTIAQTVGSASAPEDIDALAGESLHSLQRWLRVRALKPCILCARLITGRLCLVLASHLHARPS